MDLLDEVKPSCINLQHCQCSVCTFIPSSPLNSQESDLTKPNSLHQFIKLLPSAFPIMLQQTVIIERVEGVVQYFSYGSANRDQKQKWGVARQQLRSINAIPSVNVQLYHGDKQKIIPRHEAANLFSIFRGDKAQAEQIIYIQPYQPRPIVRTTYHHQVQSLENLLYEYLLKEEDRVRNANYQFNEEMLEWVYREYGEDSFCTFLTMLYARIFKIMTRHDIKSAVFFWALQPHQSLYGTPEKGVKAQYDEQRLMGRPRRLPFKPKLLNIKGMRVQIYQHYYSFQEQYSEMIKQKIYSGTKTTISAIKNKGYRLRLQNFRSKLKNVYDNEQQLILSRIQEEKQFQFHHDSEAMAQMLIPNLAPYKSLREVISDEAAFRTVFGKVLRGYQPKKRVKTQGKTASDHVRANQLSPLRDKRERSRNILKQDLMTYASRTAEKRYKLLKTPSTHE